MTDKYFYITTPIYYVNGEPHMGSAYPSLAVDVMARFKRLDGYQVKFLTGTDEHGLKVYQTARGKGIDPQEFCDQVSQKFRDLSKLMNYSNDDFIRTTEERHKKGAQAFWQKLVDRGHIYLGKYAGWYAVSDEAYYDESEIITNAKGEKVAAPSGSAVAWMEEESYFFRLSAWQDKLLDYYAANPGTIAPKSRYNEIVNFIKGGLQDLSISRTTFPWGIQVPGDPKHVMYVWIDALTNYINFLGYPDDTEDMKHYWPKAIHVVGKDIQRFHAIYWIAFLMAADLPMPQGIFSHGWLMAADGRKMSKSLSNGIMPHEFVETYGLDQTRYYLMREVPFGQDGNIGHEGIQRRMNGDLANDFGNLAQRVLSFIYKNAEASLPGIGVLTTEDQVLLDASYDLLEQSRKHLDNFAFHMALENIWNIIRAANIYVDQQAPWSLRKTDPVRMGTVLGVLCETIRRIAILCWPFMPESMDRMLDQLVVGREERDFRHITREVGLKQGAKISQPQGIFPRYAASETDVPA